VPFTGFASAPLLSLKSGAGWRALVALVRASGRATLAMRREPADVVFSTGGYSAAPVLWAARRLGIPYVLLESNSVPGRTTTMFVPRASRCGYVFRASESHFPPQIAERTGQPVRDRLRAAAAERAPESAFVLVMGGSQGSAFLNETVPLAARDLPNVRFLHATGRSHFEAVAERVAALGLGERYALAPYLEEPDLLAALKGATLAVARSGGTLAEFAAFRLPSVLVPLPTSAGNHQMVNAQEFQSMGAATISPQPSEDLASQIGAWIDDEGRRERARQALEAWDISDATARLVRLIQGAMR
jgi:UDP-N-acetylglucosamine--N-acetylmuramyl-(pentapeptide) pyrophosphoryl-undecaprenol N-acetylglucosamine transferase